MPAVVQFGLEPGRVEVREVAVPVVSPDEVLLRVGAVGVCGSDVHQFHGTQSWPVRIPVTLGHEFCGTIEQVGAQALELGWREGERVVSETAAHICGRCAFCRAGSYNVCPHRKGFGYGEDGAMAPLVRVPSRCLHRMPPNLGFETAALTEPTCVAFNAVVERSPMKPGDAVLVLGPGPIGLLCAQMARLRGAGTIVVAGLSRDAARLQLALTLGATHTLDLETQDAVELTAGVGDGLGFDLVIDAAGVSATFALAMEAVRPLGHITKVGWGPSPLGHSLDPIVQKAVTVAGSFSHTFATWERVIALLSSGQLDVAPLVHHRAPLDGWREAFDGMHGGRFAKAVLLPN
jgi:alcohol dehydrogenase/L-iditol 2-dehydrogenase